MPRREQSKLKQAGFLAGAFGLTGLLGWAYYAHSTIEITPQTDRIVAKMPPGGDDSAARERMRSIVSQALGHLDYDSSGAISNLNAEMDPYWDLKTFRERYLRDCRFEFNDGHPASDLYYDPQLKTFFINRNVSDEDLALRLASLIDRTNPRRWVPGVDVISVPRQNSIADLEAQYAKPALTPG